MSNSFDYSYFFNIALDEVMMIRNPHAVDREELNLGVANIKKQHILNIGGDEFDEYHGIIMGAREATKRCIYYIIAKLIEERASYCKTIVLSKDRVGMVRLPFVFLDTTENCLIVVREPHRGLLWETDDYVPEDVKSIMEKTGASTFKHVFMLHDYAYLQFIGHNDDETDPGRGCNAYSFSWLFDTYFGENEYERFKGALADYRKRVDAYLGYTVTRSLNTSALVNFKKATEHSLSKFNYDQIRNRTLVNNKGVSCYINRPEEVDKLYSQFWKRKTYMVLFGSHDFSESLITAEWLRDSMRKAHAVDLTVIGTGYFKAAEQLLFDLIRLRDPSFSKDSTLGEYANYYASNRDYLLRDDVYWATRRYVVEAIFAYAKLRNGYFHKHNIKDPTIIDEIRTATILLMFLLLGSQNLSDNDLNALGIPNMTEYDDFVKMCEYVDFHLNAPFCLLGDDGTERWLYADTPLRPKFSKYKGIKCACFRDTTTGELIVINRDNLPKRMWIGRLNIIPSKEIAFEGWVKELLVFDSGHFVGPPIVVEAGFTY